MTDIELFKKEWSLNGFKTSLSRKPLMNGRFIRNFGVNSNVILVVFLHWRDVCGKKYSSALIWQSQCCLYTVCTYCGLTLCSLFLQRNVIVVMLQNNTSRSFSLKMPRGIGAKLHDTYNSPLCRPNFRLWVAVHTLVLNVYGGLYWKNVGPRYP